MQPQRSSEVSCTVPPRVNPPDLLIYRIFNFAQLPWGQSQRPRGIGFSSFSIARSMVRFISETTVGTSLLFTSPISKTANGHPTIASAVGKTSASYRSRARSPVVTPHQAIGKWRL
jgi:hypothetical protein